MLKATAIEAALKKAPLIVYTGTVTRFQYEAFRYGVMPKGHTTTADATARS